MTIKYLSKAAISCQKSGKSPNAVAEIVKNNGNFSIRYTYEVFNKIYTFNHGIPRSGLFYKLRRISSRNELTHEILKAIIKHQRRYLNTGEPLDLAPFRQAQLGSERSWTSRLVNGLSVITPTGEKKPLKWFFPTRKDINKRLIRHLLDKENEALASRKIRRPLTDKEIMAELEGEYGIKLSRWSVCHCRNEGGIPPVSRRLSGYRYQPLSTSFSALYPLTIEEVMKYAPSGSGIYEFRLKRREIDYPSGKTPVIYLGSARDIKKRLREHLGKNGKNCCIKGFIKKFECLFRFAQCLRYWSAEEKRLYNLFVTTYGAPPRCNRVSPVGNRKR